MYIYSSLTNTAVHCVSYTCTLIMYTVASFIQHVHVPGLFAAPLVGIKFTALCNFYCSVGSNKKYPVQIESQAGELIRAVSMTEASFTSLQGKNIISPNGWHYSSTISPDC
jgi:hypothetical protein